MTLRILTRWAFCGALAVAGCADAPPPTPAQFKVTTDNFCRIMTPLRTTWSVHDTTESIDNLRTIGRVKKCTCDKPKPKDCNSKKTS